MFFQDKEEKVYHLFSIINDNDLSDKYFHSPEKNELGRMAWLWISDEITRKLHISWDLKKDYCFFMRLGGYKTAAFNIKDRNNFAEKKGHNNMVLKTKEYFKNTVQKIGFWGDENYFYEVDKKEKSPPPKPNQPISNPTSNQNIWIKVSLICLPFLILALLLLIIKLMSKKGRSKN